MKYEKPEMEILQFELDNIVCNSQVTEAPIGTGDLNDPDAPDDWD